MNGSVLGTDFVSLVRKTWRRDKDKCKDHPIQATKAQRWSRGIALLFL